MIAKKIPNPHKSASKSQRIRRLIEYIHSPDTEGKSVYYEARGFIVSRSYLGHTSEMIALSQEAVRSQDTVNHYVLSWREGERPHARQVEEAVDIFLDELGWSDHQSVYALHDDTDNMHLHVVVNRVHPTTLKIIEKNRGFDKELGHRAIARIEHKQGWEPKKGARYLINGSGEVIRASEYDPEKRREPGQRQKDMEGRTGEKSAHRIAIEEATPILMAATSWEQLHRDLAAKGMRYGKTGKGATVFVGDIGVKASDVDRNVSLGKMKKRLGEYAPAYGIEVVERPPEPLVPGMPGWSDYSAARKAYYAKKAAQKKELEDHIARARQALQSQQKARRKNLLSGDWRGKGQALNAVRSVLAAEQAAERAAFRDQLCLAREAVRNEFSKFPDFENWLRLYRGPEVADHWRRRASMMTAVEGPAIVRTAPQDIRAYRGEALGGDVYYRGDGGAGDIAFVDVGHKIHVYDASRDSLLAVCQLASQKWGSFYLAGDRDDPALSTYIELAAEYGFRITNPELQDRIESERQRLQGGRRNERQGKPRWDLPGPGM